MNGILKLKNKKSLIIKIMLFVAMLCSMNAVYADSCIMISPLTITTVEASNASFLKFHILSTLDNDKKSVIVSSVKDGEGTFAIKTKNNKKCDYKASVKNGKLEIKGDNTIKVLPLDVPPELVIEGTGK